LKTFIGLTSAAALVLVTVACGQTDGGITTSVKAKFALDDLVKAHEINVTTHDHVVTLTGDVQNAAAKQQAVRLALETDGVRDVVDQLRVETAATRGELDHPDVDVDLDDDLERGAKATGQAVRDGAEATADAARKAGRAIRGAVTDSDRDSDNDGK